jgi:hypothetical protein
MLYSRQSQAGKAETFDREDRWKDKTYLLKNHHNMVKRALINVFSTRSSSLLDLACGR